MKKLIIFILSLLLPLVTSAAEEQRVLFIGNSYTFYNNLPDVLMALSKKTKCPLKVESYTAGAMSLHGFLNIPAHAKARRMLESGKYDWVVLQDQSQTPAYKPEETMNSVPQWAQIAKKADTKVLLFLTWAHAIDRNGKLQPNIDMQERTSATYCRAALQCGAKVAPVGEAWTAWYFKYPEKTLHLPDRSHPNPMGTYLAACVIHGAISGKPLKGIPGTLRLGKQTIINIPDTAATALQKAANATLKRFTPRGYLDKLEKKETALLSIEEAKKQIQSGMHIEALVCLAGKPTYTSAHGESKTYQFRIRGGAELCAYCNSADIIEQISIAAPGKPVEIIDLR